MKYLQSIFVVLHTFISQSNTHNDLKASCLILFSLCNDLSVKMLRNATKIIFILLILNFCRYPAFFYNKDTQRCEPFAYSGCGGNNNRFLTVQQCESTCGNFKYLSGMFLLSSVKPPFLFFHVF